MNQDKSSEFEPQEIAHWEAVIEDVKAMSDEQFHKWSIMWDFDSMCEFAIYCGWKIQQGEFK